MQPQAARVEEFPPNTIIFNEGDHGDAIYVLMAGGLAVHKGNRFVAAIGQEGAFIGEMGSLLGSKRSATVITKSPTKMLVIPGGVENLFLAKRQIGFKLVENLRRRLGVTIERSQKQWFALYDDMKAILKYEATVKSMADNRRSIDDIDKDKKEIDKIMTQRLEDDRHDYYALERVSVDLKIHEIFVKRVKEKYPKFSPFDFEGAREVWKAMPPESAAHLKDYAVKLAGMLDQITGFVSSFEIMDRETEAEEMDVLERAMPFEDRSKQLVDMIRDQSIRELGLDRTKLLLRDINSEIEELFRNEKISGRMASLYTLAKNQRVLDKYVRMLRTHYASLLSET